MASISNQNFGVSYNPKGLCRIVGFACLAGFLVDMIVLTFPPALGNVEWRVGFLQQLGDRSIILLLGLALIMYSWIDIRPWRRKLALACLIIGVVFNLSSVLAIRDNLKVQEMAITNISTQASQLQTQIQKAQADPKANPNLTPERLEQAAQLLNSQANALKQNAKTSVLKNGISSVGNLVVVGLALIGLGQYGARPPKN
ncbi:MAG TPA: hypothetical protein IGS53_09735 [Leptolyngbyaceae cyanobacterium M33_DOE_097]|uniref:Uncharacterized protein n=1 Tax=Oscillatoriales cyanobacterium SpSt-418 TaxID=2282169 RepID=A0A7C3KC73_9CYAN|nr:hypothetical protein [Leptolyngbyaceae cyanobacterium M33_DOE_097]